MRYIDQDMIEDQTGCTLEQFESMYVLHTSDEIIPLDPVALSDWSPCYDLTVGGMSDDDRWHAKIHNCQSLIESCSADDVPRAAALEFYEKCGTWIGPDLTAVAVISEVLSEWHVDTIDKALDVLAIEHGMEESPRGTVCGVWAIGPTAAQLRAVIDIVLGVA